MISAFPEISALRTDANLAGNTLTHVFIDAFSGCLAALGLIAVPATRFGGVGAAKGAGLPRAAMKPASKVDMVFLLMSILHPFIISDRITMAVNCREI